MIAFSFDVDRRTAGTHFKLEATDGIPPGRIDIHIAFYRSLKMPRPGVIYDTQDYGPEEGVVPYGMRKGVVCLREGADVDFRYSTGGVADNATTSEGREPS